MPTQREKKVSPHQDRAAGLGNEGLDLGLRQVGDRGFQLGDRQPPEALLAAVRALLVDAAGQLAEGRVPV